MNVPHDPWYSLLVLRPTPQRVVINIVPGVGTVARLLVYYGPRANRAIRYLWDKADLVSRSSFRVRVKGPPYRLPMARAYIVVFQPSSDLCEGLPQLQILPRFGVADQ